MLSFQHISKKNAPAPEQQKINSNSISIQKRKDNKDEQMEFPFQLLLQRLSTPNKINKSILNLVNQEQSFTQKNNDFASKLALQQKQNPSENQRYITNKLNKNQQHQTNELNKSQQQTTDKLNDNQKQIQTLEKDLINLENTKKQNLDKNTKKQNLDKNIKKQNLDKNINFEQEIKNTKEPLIEKKQFSKLLEEQDKGQLSKSQEELTKIKSLIKNSNKNTYDKLNTNKQNTLSAKVTLQQESDSKNTVKNDLHLNQEKDNTSTKNHIISTSTNNNTSNKKLTLKDKKQKAFNKVQSLHTNKIDKNQQIKQESLQVEADNNINELSQLKVRPDSMLSSAEKVINKRVQNLLKYVDNKEVKAEINKKIEKMISQSRLNIRNSKSIEIDTQLYPKELGKISLNLSMQNNVLHGKFLVENEVIQNMLFEKMQELVEQFKKEGYSIGDFSVDVQDQSNSNKKTIHQEQLDNTEKIKEMKNSTHINTDSLDMVNMSSRGIYA